MPENAELTKEQEELDEDKYDIDYEGYGDGIVTYNAELEPVPESDPFAIESDIVKSLSGVSPNKKRSITAMEKRFEGRADTKSKQLEYNIITGYNAFGVVLPPYNQDYLAKLYECSAPHYAAINAKVANIVGLGYDFIPSNNANKIIDDAAAANDEKKQAKIQRKLAQAKIDLEELLDSLNEEDTFAEILAKVWKDYEATGNGYIEIAREDTKERAIGYIGHVPSTSVRVRRERDGFVQIIANKAVFFRNFGKTDADVVGNDPNPSELIHIKKYAPSSTFYGVPDIVAAQQAIAGNDFAAKFNLDYFENKAVPRHVIILKGATINPRLAKNILEFFETGLKGKNHRSLFIPLPGDTQEKKIELKIEPVEAGIQDASFVNYKKGNLGEILWAHRVPMSKIGLADGIALAAARDADKTFKEQVCQPEQKILEKKLNRIFKELTDLFILDLNELTLTDENTQSQIDERRRKTGIETANEQRVRRGLPALPGIADELFDMNAAAKVAQMSDKTIRRGQDITAETAAATPKPAAGTGAGAGANASGNPAGTRQRDTARSANATDSAGSATGRNAKGDGRATK